MWFYDLSMILVWFWGVISETRNHTKITPKSHQNHTKITPRPGFEYQLKKTWKNMKKCSVQTSEMVSDARLNHNACYILTGQAQLCFKMCCVDRLKMFRDEVIWKIDAEVWYINQIFVMWSHIWRDEPAPPREFCWVQNPPRWISPSVHSSWPGAVVAPQALTQSVCRSRCYWPPRNRAR